MNTDLKWHLINKYRESISERYDYDAIKHDPNLPKLFTRKTVNELKTFFLENLYTEPEHRKKLDAAFTQLETFIAHPSKIWGLLGSLPAAILQFGFNFPAAVRAAMNALETHTAARHFEDGLLQAALDKGFKVPVSNKHFHECLTAIPVEQLESFIKDLTSLFHVISDTALLGKTIHIMEDVLQRMEDQKDIYGPEDKDAIGLGLGLFRKSFILLEKYDEEMKKEIVEFVIYNETKFIEGLHKKKKRTSK